MWRLKFRLLRLRRRLRRQERGIKMIGPAGIGKTLTMPGQVSHEGVHRLPVEVQVVGRRGARFAVPIYFEYPDRERLVETWLNCGEEVEQEQDAGITKE